MATLDLATFLANNVLQHWIQGEYQEICRTNKIDKLLIKYFLFRSEKDRAQKHKKTNPDLIPQKNLLWIRGKKNRSALNTVNTSIFINKKYMSILDPDQKLFLGLMRITKIFHPLSEKSEA